MNLRVRAEQDLSRVLEDSKAFGCSVTVTNPENVTATLTGQTGDIHLLFDPETGIPISNRTIHLSLRISSLQAAGLGIPRAVLSEDENPWSFQFEDVNQISRKFTVSESRPDRTLGIVTVILELLKDE